MVRTKVEGAAIYALVAGTLAAFFWAAAATAMRENRARADRTLETVERAKPWSELPPPAEELASPSVAAVGSLALAASPGSSTTATAIILSSTDGAYLSHPIGTTTTWARSRTSWEFRFEGELRGVGPGTTTCRRCGRELVPENGFSGRIEIVWPGGRSRWEGCVTCLQETVERSGR